jgi:hypothetical protein
MHKILHKKRKSERPNKEASSITRLVSCSVVWIYVWNKIFGTNFLMPEFTG